MTVNSTQKEPWRLSAAEALPLLRSGDLKVVDYARSLLHRIQSRDADVKAWVFLSPRVILHQAEKLDEVPLANRGPLFGLPIAVKDIILTKDMPTQYNSRIFTTDVPIGMDANCIMTLRASGALVFGKTTTTEFATTKQGHWHQNLTANANDPERTPGGSSSGSGAAVGDFQIPIALGTQTGGSIIRPASFNGCYGFKPTWGALSKDGIGQWSMSNDTLGFFSRTVEDLDLLMDLFKVVDDRPLPKDPFNLKGARVGLCKTHNWGKAGPGTQQAIEKAKNILKSHGATVEEIDLPDDFNRVLDWHADLLTREGQSSFLGQYSTNKSLLHTDIAAHVENKRNVSRKQQLEAEDNCARLRVVFDGIASKYDAIITPSVVDEAPTGLENTGDMSFCSTWTIMHVPAINIPGFCGENDMPIGLTAVSPRFTDRHLLHVSKSLGKAFEKEGGWHRMVAEIPPQEKGRRMSGYRSIG